MDRRNVLRIIVSRATKNFSLSSENEVYSLHSQHSISLYAKDEGDLDEAKADQNASEFEETTRVTRSVEIPIERE
jgi:hypothetical protein